MISAGPFLRVPRALAVPFVALTALTSTASSLHAQAAAPDEARTGTLIVAHGGGPDWNRQVEALAAEVKLTGPVGVSFLMGAGAKSHRFQDVARDLERRGARRIIVVPLLVSSHSGHYEQIRYLSRRGGHAGRDHAASPAHVGHRAFVGQLAAAVGQGVG
jgi:hypothetical protein